MPKDKTITTREVELEEQVAVLRDALNAVPPPSVIQHDGFQRWWLTTRAEALEATR